MAPSRFQRTSAVLLAATLVASSSAIEFAGENDVTQTAGTVAPGGETQGSTSGSYASPSQWAQTAASTASSGSQNWTPPTSTDASNSWAPTSGQASASGGQDWKPPMSADASNSWTPTSGVSSGTGDQGYSLECSGSSDAQTPDTDYSLECSGSDESTPTVSTSTAGSSNSVPTATTAPTTSSGSADQTWSQPSSTASSSNPVTSASSGEYEDALQSTASSSTSAMSTASSGTFDQGSSISSTASSSNTVTSSTTEQPTASSSNTVSSGSSATQSTNSTSSGDHATFGTITSKPGECVVGSPNTYISTEDLQWVWDNRIKSEVMVYNNWIMDHLVANKGTINYCVRWDSNTTKLTKEVGSKLEGMLTRQHAAWNHWLVGYDCWPFDEIKVNVVGFAARQASDIEWSDDSLGKLYFGDLDKDGSPQCPDICYRSVDGSAGAWSESSGCDGEPFDISLWPTQGLGGGWGTYWGQQVNLDNMLEHLDDEQLEIVGHEMGHGFGLPDFYQMPKPDNFPPTLMDAFTSSYVRDTDGWMLRRVLENKKSNYNF